MPVARNRHAAVALNGRLYVLGGHDGADSLASVHSYDPETMEWREEAPMSTVGCPPRAAILQSFPLQPGRLSKSPSMIGGGRG